jgi:hypothetical protein
MESIDPLSPVPSVESYGAFHPETTAVSCAPGCYTPSLAIDMSFLESWSPSPFSSSPCTPASYSAGPFSPVEAVPAPPTTALPYDMVAQFDSCGSVRFDRSQETALQSAGLGCDPMIHVPHTMDQHLHSALKGSIQFFNHKFTVPEVVNMDVAGSTDIFAPSAQNFGF